jgi:outer membrane protein assembly factor BamB
MSLPLIDFVTRTPADIRCLIHGESDRTRAGTALAILAADPTGRSARWPLVLAAYRQLWAGYKTHTTWRRAGDLLAASLEEFAADREFLEQPDLVAAFLSVDGSRLEVAALSTALVAVRQGRDILALGPEGFQEVPEIGALQREPGAGLWRASLTLSAGAVLCVMARATAARAGVFRLREALMADMAADLLAGLGGFDEPVLAARMNRVAPAPMALAVSVGAPAPAMASAMMGSPPAARPRTPWAPTPPTAGASPAPPVDAPPGPVPESAALLPPAAFEAPSTAPVPVASEAGAEPAAPCAPAQPSATPEAGGDPARFLLRSGRRHRTGERPGWLDRWRGELDRSSTRETARTDRAARTPASGMREQDLFAFAEPEADASGTPTMDAIAPAGAAAESVTPIADRVTAPPPFTPRAPSAPFAEPEASAPRGAAPTLDFATPRATDVPPVCDPSPASYLSPVSELPTTSDLLPVSELSPAADLPPASDPLASDLPSPAEGGIVIPTRRVRQIAGRHGAMRPAEDSYLLRRWFTWSLVGLGIVAALIVLILIGRFLTGGGPEGPRVTGIPDASESARGTAGERSAEEGLPPAAAFTAVSWTRTFKEAITSSPLLAADRVIVGGRDGNLYALGVNDGAEVWRLAVGSGIGSSPAACGPLAVVGTYGGDIVAADLGSGGERWRFKTGGKIVSSPAYAADRDLVVIGSHDHHVYALKATDGSLAWKARTGGIVWASPAIAGDRVYVGAHDRAFYCLDLESGRVVWKATAASTFSTTAAAAADRVIVGTTGGEVAAFAAADGERLWTARLRSACGSAAVLAGDNVLIGTDGGSLFALRAADGGEVYRVRTGGPVKCRPALDEAGHAWITSYDGRLRVLDAATGAEKWGFPAKGRLYSSPAVLGRTAFFGSMDGAFYAATWSEEEAAERQ